MSGTARGHRRIDLPRGVSGHPALHRASTNEIIVPLRSWPPGTGAPLHLFSR
jgi:hypothetical protein